MVCVHVLWNTTQNAKCLMVLELGNVEPRDRQSLKTHSFFLNLQSQGRGVFLPSWPPSNGCEVLSWYRSSIRPQLPEDRIQLSPGSSTDKLGDPGQVTLPPQAFVFLICKMRIKSTTFQSLCEAIVKFYIVSDTLFACPAPSWICELLEYMVCLFLAL